MRDEFENKSNLLYYVLQATQDGIWDWHAHDDSVFYSEHYLSMMGYTAEQFPANLDSWIQALHPEDRDDVINLQFSHIDSPLYGDSFECTFRFKAADGSWRWILNRGIVIERDEAGRALRAVGAHTDVTELHNAQESLRHMLNIDPLTGVSSRLCLETELTSLQTGKADPVSVIFCDVDGLKLVNDNLGHATGDELLKTVGSLLRSTVRQSDMVARIGGDEFVVLLTACSFESAMQVKSNLDHAFDNYNATMSNMPVFISAGCATGHLRRTPNHELLTQADQAMQRDKRAQHRLRRERLKKWLELNAHISIDIENDSRVD